MTNQGKPNDHHHDLHAPKFMRPQRPVLDEPLEEDIQDGQEEFEANAPGLESEGDHEGQNMDATQELKPKLEPSRLAEEKVDENGTPEMKAYSAYFPRGVYEDARTVEAYYGRGEAELDGSQPENDLIPAESQRERKSRWLVLIFAVLMILVLLFLALTDRVPVAIY